MAFAFALFLRRQRRFVVFVCDNLAFRSEIVVARKHTRNGRVRFLEALSRAIGTLSQFQEKERERITFAMHKTIPDETAESIMLRAFEKGIVSHRLLPRVLQEWRQPGLEDFQPRTLWSLEQCFTGVLDDVRKANPQRFAALTIQLQDLLGGPETPMSAEVVHAAAA